MLKADIIFFFRLWEKKRRTVLGEINYFSILGTYPGFHFKFSNISAYNLNLSIDLNEVDIPRQMIMIYNL